MVLFNARQGKAILIVLWLGKGSLNTLLFINQNQVGEGEWWSVQVSLHSHNFLLNWTLFSSPPVRFQVTVYETVDYVHHFHAYSVRKTSEKRLVSLDYLVDHDSLHIMPINVDGLTKKYSCVEISHNYVKLFGSNSILPVLLFIS